MASTSVPASSLLQTDTVLVESIVSAVEGCLSMCGCQAGCVGLSRVPTHEIGTVTGIIGVHGDVSGFITVNMAERVAIAAVAGLLQEPLRELNSQVIDGVGEITNLIVGGIKKKLSASPWGFRHVTVPSVIVGRNYRIAFAGGLEFVAVTFEHRNPEAIMLDERLLQVAVSLIRL